MRKRVTVALRRDTDSVVPLSLTSISPSKPFNARVCFFVLFFVIVYDPNMLCFFYMAHHIDPSFNTLTTTLDEVIQIQIQWPSR